MTDEIGNKNDEINNLSKNKNLIYELPYFESSFLYNVIHIVRILSKTHKL